MTTTSPPSPGDEGWGTTLDSYLSYLSGLQSNTATSLSNHEANDPADPHGDRAYALQLMAPLQANVNRGNGFMQLNSSGQQPLANWVDLRPLTSAFVPATGLYPPQYQVTMDGKVYFAGYIALNSATYNGQRVFVNALPSAVTPNMAVQIPVTINAAGTGTGQPPMITVGSDGSVTLSGCPTGLGIGTAIGIYGWYPLDSYYSLIQS